MAFKYAILLLVSVVKTHFGAEIMMLMCIRWTYINKRLN
jgi:hypothetical protein